MYTASKTGDSRMDRAMEMLSFFYCGEKNTRAERREDVRRPRDRRSGRRAA